VITPDGIEIFVENVWTSSKGNFYRDLHILRNSGAQVKIFIVNPDIINDKLFEREYDKARISERKRGIAISSLINGSMILNNPEFMDQEFTETVDKLVSLVKSPSTPKTAPKMVKHSKNILLTRADYQGLDHWAPENLMSNLLLHGNDRLETKYLMQHFKSGHHEELWLPLMEYKAILEKYDRLVIPCFGPE
jgi:hypothetical protein